MINKQRLRDKVCALRFIDVAPFPGHGICCTDQTLTTSQTVFVAGGSRGLGREIAMALAAQGEVNACSVVAARV